MKLCGEEMLVFCKGIKPGSPKVFTCLLKSVRKPSFSNACKKEVLEREKKLKSDWRLDQGVSQECARDVDVHCGEEKARAHGNAEVLKCLVNQMVDPGIEIAEGCEKEVSRCALRCSLFCSMADVSVGDIWKSVVCSNSHCL
jgi:hypothetical protein